MTPHQEHDFQVLRALALAAPHEASTLKGSIIAATALAPIDVDQALRRLQMLGHIRSLTLGRWFISREGVTALRAQVKALEQEADHG